LLLLPSNVAAILRSPGRPLNRVAPAFGVDGTQLGEDLADGGGEYLAEKRFAARSMRPTDSSRSSPLRWTSEGAAVAGGEQTAELLRQLDAELSRFTPACASCRAKVGRREPACDQPRA
jgi:hypothetical protein